MNTIINKQIADIFYNKGKIRVRVNRNNIMRIDIAIRLRKMDAIELRQVLGYGYVYLQKGLWQHYVLRINKRMDIIDFVNRVEGFIIDNMLRRQLRLVRLLATTMAKGPGKRIDPVVKEKRAELLKKWRELEKEISKNKVDGQYLT